jgi:hypothetical protein
MDVFRGDPRVLAAYMTGSVGTEREDEHSDADPLLLVRASDFEAFDAGLPAVFRALGAEPVLWWPERINCDTLRNYAVFYEREGELLQYDITITVVADGARAPVEPGRAIFDTAGILDPTPPRATSFSPERLRWTIEMYWIYIYIHTKYLKRGHRFRLVAAQQELLQCHLHVLRALAPDVPLDWWPITAERVSAALDGGVLATYLSDGLVSTVKRALPWQMARFSDDARAACEAWAVDYPSEFEEKVLRHVSVLLG